MKRVLFSLTGLAAIVLAICSQAFLPAKAAGEPAALPSYRLTWHDEFNGHALDTASWSLCRRTVAPWAKYMSANTSLYEVRGGRLRLYGRLNRGLEPADTARYLTGGICSEHKRTVGYGKIEVRARIHGVTGGWPAIWTSTDDAVRRRYPWRSEVDLVEYLNLDPCVQYTVHNNYTDILRKTAAPKHHTTAPIRRERWNTYTLEILPDRLVYSVNGTVAHVYPKIETRAEGQYPFGRDPQYLLLTMQLGNKYLPPVDDSQLPAYMDVDWVRFYELKQP